MCYAFPVSTIEDFRPLHRTDFDNQKVYLVHRTEENGCAGQPCEAQILALADDEEEEMEAEHRHHHHQQQQHLEVDAHCVSEVVAAVVPRVLYEELVHSYRQQEEEMRRLQQELERTRRQLVQQAKKLKEYGSLLTEVKELRDFNRRLQDVLLMRLGSGERTGACSPTHNPLQPVVFR
ncbi:hypothetical protein GOODEAATRI_011584 [Goodea atripinnis]|uniref:BEN domain-containing protein n=1 Tax=Goodea atripinnis TaxID=208336 RepID=A0ABV0MRB8_9TELE